MAVVEELIRSESNGAISFGNHKLEKKAKVEDYQHAGDLLKVKTCREITKLEKNGSFLYESVPGTSVLDFAEKADGVEFVVEVEVDAVQDHNAQDAILSAWGRRVEIENGSLAGSSGILKSVPASASVNPGEGE